MNHYLKTLLQKILICSASSALAQNLQLPPRDANAPDGDAFARKISALNFTEREAAIGQEIFAGNVPAFLRKFCTVTITNVSKDQTNIATFFAAPDYLAVGSDENYFLTPVSPNTAQLIADQLGCILPTRRMVDAIYAVAHCAERSDDNRSHFCTAQ